MPDPAGHSNRFVISSDFMGPGGFTAMAVPTDIDFYNLINATTDPVTPGLPWVQS